MSRTATAARPDASERAARTLAEIDVREFAAEARSVSEGAPRRHDLAGRKPNRKRRWSRHRGTRPR